MAIEELKAILNPPKKPYKAGNNQGWTQLEKNLGISLPLDYKNFIGVYGTGGIDNFLWILTPFVQDENVNFLKRMNVMNDAYLESKQQFPMYYKHDVFPSPGGLLPWAYTDNGDELYWLTAGEPDNWSIIVYESRSPDYHEYSMSLTKFLYEVLSRNLICEAFPEDFPSEEPEFIAVDVE